MWRTLTILAALLAVCLGQGCVQLRSELRGKDDGYYCVCNSTYCDEAPTLIGSRNRYAYRLVSSSKDGLRYNYINGTLRRLETLDQDVGRITIDRLKIYQKIFGIGGAITDATGMNIESLSIGARENLMKSYFGPSGSEYSFIRTPMGGSDFSTRPYSYAMTEGDVDLEDFSLTEEDFLYKIPYIQWAQDLSKRKIKLVTAPWSPSPWMKTEDTWSAQGKLRPEYWQLWADYFANYFEAYRKHGLEFWATSPQNEPGMLTYLDIPINGMSWTAEEQRDWVANHLAPTLKRRGFGKLKILVSDDNRVMLPEWTQVIFQNETVRNLVAGTAMHWYFDGTLPVTVLDEIKELAPEKLMVYTEACTGADAGPEEKVILGSWYRGEQYAVNIIETFNHGVQGWIDWNMALNLEGGPSWIKNFVDSPIIVNAKKDEFYKQPMFYVLGHFSKYVPSGSSRISSVSKNLDGVKHVAFLTPDHATVVVILNTNEKEVSMVVDDPRRRSGVKLELPAKSVNTLLYW